MSKFHQVIEQEDGWSDWEYPNMEKYKMQCCDCGLVHDIEFQAIRITKQNEDGSFQFEELPKDQFCVRLKAKRNNRSTGQIRRHKKSNVIEDYSNPPCSNCGQQMILAEHCVIGYPDHHIRGSQILYCAECSPIIQLELNTSSNYFILEPNVGVKDD